jgi:hypothetical protein
VTKEKGFRIYNDEEMGRAVAQLGGNQWKTRWLLGGRRYNLPGIGNLNFLSKTRDPEI